MAKLKYYLLTKSLGLYLNILVYFKPKKAQLLAYTLFSTPRKGKLASTTLPHFLQNHISEKLTYKDYSVQTYLWPGNNKVILLVHGWESNTTRWKKALPHLLKLGKTIVAIDAPAHGLTSGVEFNVLIYTEVLQIAIEKFQPQAIIGHSIGGAALVYNQYKYPTLQVQKLVVLGAPDDISIILKNYIRLLSLNSKNEQLFIAYFESNFNIEVATFSGSNFAKTIKTPTLIIHDEYDEVVLFEEGKKLESAFENAVFMKTNSLGHSLHGAQVYQKILSFLEN